MTDRMPKAAPVDPRRATVSRHSSNQGQRYADQPTAFVVDAPTESSAPRVLYLRVTTPRLAALSAASMAMSPRGLQLLSLSAIAPALHASPALRKPHQVAWQQRLPRFPVQTSPPR